ncbi:MAG: hypothetical protein RBS09_06090 [Anaerolineaceae bacterium]|jgi:hypothetical protein|nr:hypothetical protein [Anaerolineaceae bacterium]
MQKMTNRINEELRRLAFEHHDECVLCGYKFQEGDTTHLGYDTDDKPLYVCDECSNKLKETAVRHYFMPRPYEIPPNESKLWRYSDFAKYVSMLSTKGLYFARADCFQDPFEGAKGFRRNKAKWDSYYLHFFREAIKNPPECNECKFSNKEVEKHAKRLLAELEFGGEHDKKRTYINCWHENEHESEAMWRLYSSFLENAIAVRTSYNSLYHSLGRNAFIDIGRVMYIDFQKSYSSVNDAFWYKRKSFEHEKEVRAILIDMHCPDTGKIMPCDLSILIEEVFVSPNAPIWFTQLVNDVNEKYGINKKVSPSELAQEPFF